MQASFHFERRNFQEIIFRKFDEFCSSEYINYLKSSIVKLWNQQTVFSGNRFSCCRDINLFL